MRMPAFAFKVIRGKDIIFFKIRCILSASGGNSRHGKIERQTIPPDSSCLTLIQRNPAAKPAVLFPCRHLRSSTRNSLGILSDSEIAKPLFLFRSEYSNTTCWLSCSYCLPSNDKSGFLSLGQSRQKGCRASSTLRPNLKNSFSRSMELILLNMLSTPSLTNFKSIICSFVSPYDGFRYAGMRDECNGEALSTLLSNNRPLVYRNGLFPHYGLAAISASS